MKKPIEKNNKAIKISVIGGGSWATAIAKILTHNGHDVKWWVRQPETAKHIVDLGHNPKYLSSVEFDLPESSVSSDLEYIISEAEYIVLAVPSYYFSEIVASLKPSHFRGKTVISAIKGIVLETSQVVTQYMHTHFHIPQDKLANISGPCHAEEVASEKLSYLTFASSNDALAQEIAAMFNNRFLHTTCSADMIGTEYASVIKNVYAIAAGISVGLGYGDNFRAVLVSRAMEGMQRFLEKIVPAEREMSASAYLGDTLVTAYSQHSRNRTFGLMIGKGYSVNNAILELNMVAEGYYGTKAIKKIAGKHELSLPVVDAVYHILYEKYSPSIEFRLLSEKLS